jgi:hypothetical protein
VAVPNQDRHESLLAERSLSRFRRPMSQERLATNALVRGEALRVIRSAWDARAGDSRCAVEHSVGRADCSPRKHASGLVCPLARCSLLPSPTSRRPIPASAARVSVGLTMLGRLVLCSKPEPLAALCFRVWNKQRRLGVLAPGSLLVRLPLPSVPRPAALTGPDFCIRDADALGGAPALQRLGRSGRDGRDRSFSRKRSSMPGNRASVAHRPAAPSSAPVRALLNASTRRHGVG